MPWQLIALAFGWRATAGEDRGIPRLADSFTWCPPAGGLQKIAKRELPILAMRLVYSEPFIWSPQPEELDGFVRESGLALIESVPGLDLVQRYTKKRASLVQQLLSAGNMRLCVAEVERPV